MAGTSGVSVERAGFAGQGRPARSVLRWLGDGLVAWLPALPLLILAFALLVAPTIALVIQSFRGDTHHWTLQFWDQTLHRKGDLRAIKTSVRLGAICATISLVVGGPLAWLVSRMVTFTRATWLALLNVAANFGGIGLAFGYISALGTYGMVTLGLHDLQIPFHPPQPGTFTSLVIAYEYTNVPLFVLLTLPAMGILRKEWMEAAETAAATRLQFWRYVGIPILTPFLAAGWLLIFTWSIGIYGIAYALAGGSSGGLRLMTLQIGIAINSAATSPERAAVHAVLLLFFATVTLLAYRLILRWALRWFS